ncbi:MAG: VCBS repeat-containing protein, partial [Xanthomonadales bacterium]|nr:VCBS repeat-containing protein [Xanthomonadales bacterium]
MRAFGASLLLLALLGCQPQSEPMDPAEIARNNEAVGLMGQYRNEAAHAIFTELAQRYPDQPVLRSNEAIAMLNRQTEGDEERALKLALDLLQTHPDHLPALYVAGLAHLYLGRVEQALPYLQSVAERDRHDGHAAYFAGQAYAQLGRTDEALALYRQAMAADPYLGSAYYAAALALRGRGEAEPARELLADYQRLQGNPRAQLAEFRYTRMGAKATAQVIGTPAEPPSPTASGVLFDPAVLITDQAASATGSLLTADLDGDGRQDLLLIDAGVLQLWLGEGDGYAGLVAPTDLPAGLRTAAFGDLDNDGVLDVALCGKQGLSLWTISTDSDWSPRADRLPESTTVPCHDLQLFDADHDGDLDLYRLSGAGMSGELYNNNLDGSWRALSSETPLLAGPAGGTRQLLVADVDADRDLDLLFIGGAGNVEWLRNDRLWAYVEQTLDAPWQAGWTAAIAVDLAATGQPDLILLDEAGQPWVGQLPAGSLTPLATPNPLRPALDLQSLDIDGDGQPDLLLRHADGLTALSRDPQGLWQTLWRHDGPTAAALAVLEQPARGYSLILAGEQSEQSGLWRLPPGPGRQRFLAVAPSGKQADVEGMRSNASGLGTQLRLRRGTHWTVAELLDRNSAPGQSLQPIALGLGQAAQADFLELQWSDGVMQTELALDAGEVHRISENQRQLASCPVLFVWDGTEFRFVSDLLGVGGVGFLLAPGVYAESRPWEYFRLPDDLAQVQDGVYRLKIAEPMEEAAYLDSVQLHVYDLPPGWAMSLDERMHTGGGPAPTGAPIYYRPSQSPGLRSVLDAAQGEQLPALHMADFVALDPGPRDPRFLGRLAQPQQLRLQLATPMEATGEYVLVGHGWVEYPYSQTLFAAWQAGASYESYSLDVADENGGWRELYRQFGYPAGMPREFALPLPAGLGSTEALRLRGNLEVYLDRLDVVRREAPPPQLRHQVIAPDQARLERIGYPRRSSHAGKRPDYDFNDRSPFWDTRYPLGQYTDFGPVGPLLAAVDDGFAIVGPGDALDLSFSAPPPPPEGYTRVLVLE